MRHSSCNAHEDYRVEKLVETKERTRLNAAVQEPTEQGNAT